MNEEKIDFARLIWLWGKPRNAEEITRCRWLFPRALVSVTVSLQEFEIPQDPLVLGMPKKKLMAQVPVLQGPPMMHLACRCPDLLEYVKVEQNPTVREQIRETMPRAEFCSLCPFWTEKEGLPEKPKDLQLAQLPWYGKLVCLAFMGMAVFVAALAYPVACVRSLIRRPGLKKKGA